MRTNFPRIKPGLSAEPPTGGGTGRATPPNQGSGGLKERPMQEIMALAEIRAVTGLGSKPMLSELAAEIGKLLAAKDAKIARLREIIAAVGGPDPGIAYKAEDQLRGIRTFCNKELAREDERP